MRGLTLTQPWATLMAIGAKKIETRSWQVSYRGPVAIQAAKTFPTECRELLEKPVFESALVTAGITEPLPLGQIIAVGILVDIVPVERIYGELGYDERQFGNYLHGRYAWKFENLVLLDHPISVKGCLGLWQVAPDSERVITDQLRPKDYQAIFGDQSAA